MMSQPGHETITIRKPNKKQPDNEVWSVNRMQQEKYFSSKSCRKFDF